jgi:hypothetical protein
MRMFHPDIRKDDKRIVKFDVVRGGSESCEGIGAVPGSRWPKITFGGFCRTHDGWAIHGAGWRAQAAGSEPCRMGRRAITGWSDAALIRRLRAASIEGVAGWPYPFFIRCAYVLAFLISSGVGALPVAGLIQPLPLPAATRVKPSGVAASSARPLLLFCTLRPVLSCWSRPVTWYA